MKKFICLILAVIMTLALFVGCGASESPKVTPTPKLDLSELEKAMSDAIGNAPKNFRYEYIDTNKNGEMYIMRLQYRDGDKLKYWDYCTEKYIKDDKGAGGHFDYVYDYSKKTEADIKDDEWIYAEKEDRNFYVLYFGWASSFYDVDKFFDDVENGRKKFVKAENGVYGYYYYGDDKNSKKAKAYSEFYIDHGIEVKILDYVIDENGNKTDKIERCITQSMFGEVSFDIPKKK